MKQTLKTYYSLVLLLMFLTPSAIQLSHSFETHEHVNVCSSKANKHFHELNIDSCKICDFTYSMHIFPEFLTFSFAETPTILAYPSYYHFLESSQKIFFSLRAPPSLV